MWNTIERTDHDEGVVRVSLDRPSVHNAQNLEMLEELAELLEEVDDEDETRVIVLDGNGPSFSSGHDLTVFEDMRQTISVEDRLALEEEYFWEYSNAIRDLDTPTIAQVHGACIAAGLMLMSVCDLAVAAEDARLQQPVNRMASAATELLFEPWEMGFRKAKEFMWTGDPISGTEAADLGLVNRAVPEDDLREETMVLATKIARQPPFALQLSKKTLNHAADQVGQRDAMYSHFLAHQLSHTSEEWYDWHAEAGTSKDREEGLGEWLQDRDESFSP